MRSTDKDSCSWHPLSLALLFLLSLVRPHSLGAEEQTGVVFIRVDVSQLNNKQVPTGYRVDYLWFKLRHMESGKEYTMPRPSTRYPSMFRLPPGQYCLYSISIFEKQELVYCGTPYFTVDAGAVHIAGAWRFGISYQAGTFSLMSAMEAQDDVEVRARKRYPEVFAEQPTN